MNNYKKYMVKMMVNEDLIIGVAAAFLFIAAVFIWFVG